VCPLALCLKFDRNCHSFALLLTGAVQLLPVVTLPGYLTDVCKSALASGPINTCAAAMQHWCVCDSGQAGSQPQLGLAPSSTYGQRQAAAQYRQKAQRLTSTQPAPRHVGLCWQAQQRGRVHVARRAAAPFTAVPPGNSAPPAAAAEQSSAGPSAEAGSQRAVVLTGASSGIGHATALLLAEQVLYCVHVQRQQITTLPALRHACPTAPGAEALGHAPVAGVRSPGRHET